MAALTNRTGHSPLVGYPDLLIRHAALAALDTGEFHHWRRSHNHHLIVVAKGRPVNLGDKLSHKAGIPAFLLLCIQSVEGGETVFPLLQLTLKHDALFILKTGDQGNALGVIRLIVEFV